MRRYIIFLFIFPIVLFLVTEASWFRTTRSKITHKDQVKVILDFLKNGDEAIKYSSDKNVVLFLGNTGSGKSTLVQFISNNDDTLNSRAIGRGNYIIVDDNDKISSNSTISSKTLYPDLVVDSSTGTVFYDCPGFSDTRSPAHDVAASYFIKRIIEHADSLKMVFSVIYPSVMQGMDRHGFMILVRHAINLIKDVDKYKDGIALIVTKVDNNFERVGKTLEFVTDEEVVELIASFTTEVKRELQQKSPGDKAINFIDAFLSRRNGSYTKIGLFRKPDEAGQLSQLDSFKKSKKLLQNLIKSIDFIPKSDDDFGYTISDNSRNYVRDLVEEINRGITTDFANVGDEVIQQYRAEEKSGDLELLHDKFKTVYAVLLKTIQSIESQPGAFAKKIVENLNLSISRKHLISISNQGHYLEFLAVHSKQTAANSSEWAEGLKNATEYLHASQKWYSFLINLQSILSKYSIHVDKDPKLNLGNVMGKNQKIKVSETDLEIFLKKITKSNTGYGDVENMEIEAVKANNLKMLVQQTFKEQEWSCGDDKLVVKGQVVLLSEVAKISCSARYLQIFALDKIFIDCNLDKTGDKLQMFIIAPVWEIIGKQRIVLDGKAGAAHSSKAGDGVGFSNRGRDGEPGLPGGPAGSFLGIGEIFINGQLLTITANGGNGGPGQDGGSGSNAKNGIDPTLEEKSGASFFGVGGWHVTDQWKRKGFEFIEVDYTITSEAPNPNNMGKIESIWKYEVFGKKAEGNGGDGGDGGAGGKGGYQGTIKILSQSPVVTLSKTGRAGEEGRGGKSGEGGRHGDTLVVICKTESLHIHVKCSNYELRQAGFSSAGKSGTSGKNSKDLIYPENPDKITNSCQAINAYKSFLRQALPCSVRRNFLENFHDQLENSNIVNIFYDTLGFVDELKSLENQFYQLRGQLPLLPFYNSLLRRIADFSKTNQSQGNKKVLTYIYTATLGKICSIRNSFSNNLIMDILAYVDFAIIDIKDLLKTNNQIAVNNEQKTYEKLTHNKITEAVSFVDSQITPEVNKVFAQIDDKIQTIVDETIQYQNATMEEKRDLIRQQQQLEKSLGLRYVLGTLKIGTQFLSFAGPVGATVGTLAGGAATIAESLLIDDKSGTGTDKIVSLPPAVRFSVVAVADQIKNKQTLFKHQLNDIDKKLEKYLKTDNSKDMKETKNKITEIKTEIEKLSSKGAEFVPGTLRKLYEKRKEMIEYLKEKREYLEKKKSRVDTKAESQLILLNHCQNAVRLGEISVDFYARIRNDQAKIDNLSKAIKKVDQKLTELVEFEKTIYSKMIPRFREIEDYVKIARGELDGKSHAALDVNKWKMQTTLRDLKVEIRKMTKGFSVEEDVARCIEKIEEGISTMINLYDRIQDYQDQAKLATFIADVNSNKAVGISIHDRNVNYVIDELNLIIKSNLVLGRYERLMAAFKQHIFPFANHYLQEFNLPSSLGLSNTTEDLVSTAIEKIQKIKSKLVEGRITVHKYDQYIHRNIEFSSKNHQLAPFYIWKGSKNKETINKLLEGQTVTLKAGVTKGINKNAIKFNVIGINFKSAGVQQELDKILENFEVVMTHLGNSYYRCGSKFYTITSDNQTISYYIKRDRNGDPLNTNLVYEKIKNSDYMLSPYTLWSVKLNKVRGNFTLLRKFKPENIDLELEGRGEYLDQGRFNTEVCEDLHKYYHVDESVSEIDSVGEESEGLNLAMGRMKRG